MPSSQSIPFCAFMKVSDFFYQLKVLSRDYLQYHAYSTDFLEKTIDLSKQQDPEIEGQIVGVVNEIVKGIENATIDSYRLSPYDELMLSLPEIIEIIIIVRTQFDEVMNDVEKKCWDKDAIMAINKVKMINEDIFNKIPQLASEIYYSA